MPRIIGSGRLPRQRPSSRRRGTNRSGPGGRPATSSRGGSPPASVPGPGIEHSWTPARHSGLLPERHTRASCRGRTANIVCPGRRDRFWSATPSSVTAHVPKTPWLRFQPGPPGDTGTHCQFPRRARVAMFAALNGLRSRPSGAGKESRLVEMPDRPGPVATDVPRIDGVERRREPRQKLGGQGTTAFHRSDITRITDAGTDQQSGSTRPARSSTLCAASETGREQRTSNCGIGLFLVQF